MRHTIAVLALAAASGLTHAQMAAPATGSAAEPARQQEGMQRMRGMGGMSHHHGAACLYDGRAYSSGALLHATGVGPILECVAPAGNTHEAPGGAGEHQHATAEAPAWRVYRAGR